MKIMIIDDNKDLRAIYDELFTAGGHTVALAPDGLDGITQIVDAKPDVVLLDLLMPEMDGFDFLRALHDNTSIDTCVIVCSNLSSQTDIDRALALGAKKYLRKSDYIGAQIVEAVEKVYHQ